MDPRGVEVELCGLKRYQKLVGRKKIKKLCRNAETNLIDH